MSIVNGIITAPIADRDPYVCMGVGKYNGWYDWGYICSNQHGKINKWAKYKPVRYDKVGELTERERANVNFGIDMNISSAGDSYLNNIKDGYKYGTWTYLPPRGGAEAYRITDFIGYSAQAVPFVRTGMPKGYIKEINLTETNSVSFSIIYNNSLDSGCITMEDLSYAMGGLGDLYLAAILYDADPIEDNSSAKMLGSKISEYPISDGRGIVTFDFAGNDIGTNRWVMLYLTSITSNTRMTIPVDDNNWAIFKVRILQRYLVSADVEIMGAVGGNMQGVAYWNGNPFPSNNGNADVLLYTRIENSGKTSISIGGNYKFRTYFDSRYTTNMTLCDFYGNAIAAKTLDAGKFSYFYFRANAMFKEFVDSLTGSQLSGNLRIQAYDSNAANPAWQEVGGPVPILVGKQSS